MMTATTKAYILIHLAVILFGFTAIIGTMIKVDALILVWWRVMIASVGFTFFTKGVGFLIKLPPLLIARLAGIGVLIGIHWVAFFASVKLAGASVCLLCMATTSLFVSLFEPLLLKHRFRWLDFSIALLIVPGMVLVVESVGATRWQGIVIGLLSAALAGLFSSLNKKYVSTISIAQMSWIEMVAASGFLGLVVLARHWLVAAIPWIPGWTDLFYLVVLGLVCTTFAHAISLIALRQLSAFSLNLVVNLEPVYGILLAWLLLKENRTLSSGFYFGALLILIAVLIHPFLQRKLGEHVK
jgi:drug/metabolite transporter (DMT)-like permease